MRKALSELRVQFNRWDRGEIDSFELNELVHRFHQDTARDIWKRYVTTRLEPAIASAVAAGVLRKEELPAELVQHIAAKLPGAYEEIRHASMVPHSDVVAFVRSRALSGRGMGWIDVHLLASAIVEQLPLRTADSRLLAVAKELGVVSQSEPADVSLVVRSCFDLAPVPADTAAPRDRGRPVVLWIGELLKAPIGAR